MTGPKQLVLGFAESGATISLQPQGGLPRLNIEAGYLEWIGDNRLFYFEQWGDDDFKGHVLKYSSLSSPHELGVWLASATGEQLAYICPRTEMEYSDEPDRAKAHAAWQQLLADKPETMTFILGVRDALTKDEETN